MIWDENKVPLQRQQLLDEDVSQQRELYRLTHKKEDSPASYALRERRWIRVTHFGEAGLHERAPEESD